MTLKTNCLGSMKQKTGMNMRQIDYFMNGEFVASSVGKRLEKRSTVNAKGFENVIKKNVPTKSSKM